MCWNGCAKVTIFVPCAFTILHVRSGISKLQWSIVEDETISPMSHHHALTLS